MKLTERNEKREREKIEKKRKISFRIRSNNSKWNSIDETSTIFSVYIRIRFLVIFLGIFTSSRRHRCRIEVVLTRARDWMHICLRFRCAWVDCRNAHEKRQSRIHYFCHFILFFALHFCSFFDNFSLRFILSIFLVLLCRLLLVTSASFLLLKPFFRFLKIMHAYLSMNSSNITSHLTIWRWAAIFFAFFFCLLVRRRQCRLCFVVVVVFVTSLTMKTTRTKCEVQKPKMTRKQRRRREEEKKKIKKWQMLLWREKNGQTMWREQDKEATLLFCYLYLYRISNIRVENQKQQTSSSRMNRRHFRSMFWHFICLDLFLCFVFSVPAIFDMRSIFSLYFLHCFSLTIFCFVCICFLSTLSSFRYRFRSFLTAFFVCHLSVRSSHFLLFLCHYIFVLLDK